MAVSTGEPGDSAPDAPHRVAGGRLPVELSSFIGRAVELAELRWLVDDHRLVTVAGTGGAGKTRLAMRLAEELTGEFPGGVWWVDLAPVTDPDLTAVQVERALDLPDQGGRAAVDTVARCIDGQQMLLILDNCEHLRDECAALVTSLLGSCPELKIVATSREPIGVAGEVTWRIPPLSLADEAVELFEQRARQARPDFTASGADVALVTEICRRLDGVPLAIELAATRVRVLSPQEILDGLRERFAMLTGGTRTGIGHHQTLRASLDWSHDLLSDSQRVLFRRLAVFPGSFDLDAAIAVAGDTDALSYRIVDDLVGLVDKSLVVVDHTIHPTRYVMLETIRAFAREKLVEAGEVDTVRTRHRDYFAARFDGLLVGGRREHVMQAEHELDNLRAAFAWSRRRGEDEQASRLASALQPLWVRARTMEGLAWFGAIPIDSTVLTPATRARHLTDTVTLEVLNGDYRHLQQAQQAVAIARELRDPGLLAMALAACGFVSFYSPEMSVPYFREAVELAPEMGDDGRLSQVYAMQTYSAFIAGDLASACDAAEKAMALAESVGDGGVVRLSRWMLTMAEFLTGDLRNAAEHARVGAAQAEAAHGSLLWGQGLALLGVSLAYLGDYDGARTAVQAAIESARDITGIQLGANLGRMALVLLAAGDIPGAVAASDEAFEVCPFPQLQAISGNPAAEVALASGRLATARRHVDQAFNSVAGVHRIPVLATRVRVAMSEGRPDLAQQEALETLELIAETGAYLSAPDVIECLAAVVSASGDRREAAKLFGAAAAIRDRSGQLRFAIYQDGYAAAIDSLRNGLGQKDFDESWAAGAALPTADAVAYACRIPEKYGIPQGPPDSWATLTPTERNIAALVGQGLRNKDVAERLSISPRTVETHLTRIYRKLNVSSRVQLAQAAAAHT